LDFGFHEFKTVRDMIYAKTGIFISDQKVYLLKKRIQDRINALQFSSASEYIRFLKFSDHGGKEFNNLVIATTVNETYFFREFPQLQIFAEYCLPEVVERAKKSSVRILSAGCSTGEEPYTLSIICQEMLTPQYSFSVEAIDIDDRALSAALRGIYDERSVRDVPHAYLGKYFEVTPEGYAVKDFVRRYVNFSKVNLFDQTQLTSLGHDFDFVFCRNVLIYFSDDSRRKVIEGFYTMMKPGGYIFLGHSESLSRITTAFKLKRMGGGLVYQKPLIEEG